MKKRAFIVGLLCTLSLGIYPMAIHADEQNSSQTVTMTSSTSIESSDEILDSSVEMTTEITSEPEVNTSSETTIVSDSVTESSETETSFTQGDDIAPYIQSIVQEQYATFIREADIFDISLKTIIGNTKEYAYKVYRVKEKVITADETIYYLLVDKNNNELGYLREQDVQLSNKPEGILKNEEKYVSIVSKTAMILQNINDTTGVSSTENYGIVLKSQGVIEDFEGNRYLLLKNNNNETLGYINEKSTKVSSGKVGLYQSYGKYVSIKSPNYDIWQNFDWQKRAKSSTYIGQTLQARGYYQHFNGSRYLSLYDNAGKWVGYMNETGTKLAANRGGVYQSYGKYVTIKSPNYDIWQNFDWQKRAKSSTRTGQTLQARGYYQHFNGARYLSLYDNRGKWVGYINETGTKLATGQGNYHSYGKYVTIKSPNYDIWQNFDWQKRAKSSAYYGQSLQARGYYQHFNGSRYLSLYDNRGKWIGYINETGTKLSNNGVSSIYQSYGKYVTIKTKNVGIWQNFHWKKRASSSTYYGQPLEARGYYVNFNSKKYFSLYDNKGKWIGYINEDYTDKNNSRVGFYQHYGKKVKIISPNYDIWQNFNWDKRNHSSKYNGQELEARGYYQHFNGGRYLSLYDNKGKWLGYINETGTDTNTIVVKNGITYVDGILIANKKHPLPSSYNPGENREAKNKLLQLITDMKRASLNVSDSYSGFRSYTVQKNLYANYVLIHGQYAADRFSARPGYSEHQTGLAYDLLHRDGSLITRSREVNWIDANAHKYGFIVRYKQNKESITGYQYEPWHLRYVGTKATDIYRSNKTLEEYFDIPGGGY